MITKGTINGLQYVYDVNLLRWQAMTQPIIEGGSVTATVGGTVTTSESRPSTTSVTQVAASATVVTLKASNVSRNQLIIYSDSTADLYIKLGSGASLTDYSVKLMQDDCFEFNFPAYTGIVTGIWASATGNAYVTEIT